MMRRGSHAWAVLAIGVATWTVTCPPRQTMSEAADRGLGRHPILVFGALTIVWMHVANVFDVLGVRRLDPIAQVAKHVGRRDAR